MLIQSKIMNYGMVFLAIISYFYLGYFIERQQFDLLFGLYFLVFSSFIYLIEYYHNPKNLFGLGIVFRAILLLATPFLSQDFYRFIWDGRLIVAGINPYEYLPNEIINSIANFPDSRLLFDKMGSLSASHFSNYPPINQLFFAIADVFAGKSILGSVLVFRIIIVLADIGIYYFGQKILVHFNQNPNKIFLYFLNPLVIIELTGNLHFEGVMLFFLVFGFYFLLKNNWVLSALFIAISISVKLLPLLILPLFWQKIGIKKSIVFYGLIIGFNILFFLPFVNNHLISNYLETISLWFINFEFNASFYYVIRAIGFYFKGYNIIVSVGKIIPIITILVILFYAFFRKNNTLNLIINNALIVLTIYLLLSTTVHPWYIINLVLLSVFTNYKYAIAWSFTVFLSYFAYSNNLFKENMSLIFIEYFIVFGFILLSIKNYGLYKTKKLF